MRSKHKQVLKSNEQDTEELVLHSNDDEVIQVLPEFFNTIFVNGDIDQKSATEFYKAIHYLDLDSPVFIVINSNGGDVYSALTMRNLLQKIRTKTQVYTMCIGVAFSAGALLLASGSKDCRYAAPMSSMMIHSIQLIFGGNYRTEVQPMMNFMVNLEKQFVDAMTEEVIKNKQNNFSQKKFISKKKVLNDLFHHGDTFLSAEEAKDLGLVDHIDFISLPVIKMQTITLEEGE